MSENVVNTELKSKSKLKKKLKKNIANTKLNVNTELKSKLNCNLVNYIHNKMKVNEIFPSRLSVKAGYSADNITMMHTCFRVGGRRNMTLKLHQTLMYMIIIEAINQGIKSFKDMDEVIDTFAKELKLCLGSNNDILNSINDVILDCDELQSKRFRKLKSIEKNNK